VKRWDKTKKEFVEVQRPEVIRRYNKSMGGVDKMDFLIQLYCIFIRSRKWTLRVIFHYVNLAVNNSWLEYQRDADTLKILKKKRPDLFSWCSEIAEALCKGGISCERKRGRPADSCHADQRLQRSRRLTFNQLQMWDLMGSVTGQIWNIDSSDARMQAVDWGPSSSAWNATCICVWRKTTALLLFIMNNLQGWF